MKTLQDKCENRILEDSMFLSIIVGIVGKIPAVFLLACHNSKSKQIFIHL